MLDLTRLKVFREVAIHGSFTKAAEAMGYTQPSISHQVAQLERELSAQLFERQTRRVTLTPAGQVFLRHVQTVLVQLADAEREVAETAGTGGRLLRLASFPTAAATLIPPAAADFRARHPRGELRLTEADPPLSVPALLAGEHDLAVIYDYPVLGAAVDPGDASWPRHRAVDRSPLLHLPGRVRIHLPQRGFRASGCLRDQRLPGHAGTGRRRRRGGPAAQARGRGVAPARCDPAAA